MRTVRHAFLVLFLAVLWPALALAVPKNDILIVQTAFFDFDSTKTIQDIMNAYSFFTKVDWLEYRDKQGNKVVEARGYFDLNKIKFRVNTESCTQGEAGFTGLTTTKPYLCLQYRPDFLKQRCTLLGVSVKDLSGGKEIADPNLVWAMSLFTNELPDASIFCAAPPEPEPAPAAAPPAGEKKK
jgi:hypothetical protein